MAPESEDKKLRKLLVRHRLSPVLRHIRSIFAATSSVTVAAVTGAAVRQPSTSTLGWMFAMVVAHGFILYWLQDRYLRHLERLAELSAASDAVEPRKRTRRRK